MAEKESFKVFWVFLCCLGKRGKYQVMVANKISLEFLHQDSDL